MEAVLSHISTLLLTIALGGAPQQPPAGSTGTAEPPAPPQQAAPASGGELPVDLDRIQRTLSRPPALKMKSDRPVFRVEVLGRKPTIEEILGPDYLRGPVPHGGMTHQEFLSMVTPDEFRGYSMFTNREGITLAATSLALHWALMKAVDKLKQAHSERARKAAREEVLAALNELEAANKRAAERGKKDR